MGFILFTSSLFMKHMVAYIHFQTDETAFQEGPWLCRKCMLQNSSSLDKASRSVTRTWWDTRGIYRLESSDICQRFRCHRPTSDRACKEQIKVYQVLSRIDLNWIESVFHISVLFSCCVIAVISQHLGVLTCIHRHIRDVTLFHWTGFLQYWLQGI